MSRLLVPVFSTKQFTYDPEVKTFATEMSSLPSSPFKRVYDDACDVGFELESHKTGKRILFTLAAENKDDGETISWLFLSTNKDKLGFAVEIFND
jgi:hypothetical protein